MRVDEPELNAVAGSAVNAFLTRCVQHLQLIQVELQEEKLRLRKMLVMLLLSVGMLICSLIVISIFILVATWDTPFRLSGIGALAAIYCALTGFFWFRFSMLGTESSDLFVDSRRELEADFHLLQGRWKE